MCSISKEPRNMKHPTKTFESPFGITVRSKKDGLIILLLILVFMLALGVLVAHLKIENKICFSTSNKYTRLEKNWLNGTSSNDGWQREDGKEKLSDLSNAENVTFDYVYPIKLHQSVLNYEDLLYESKRNKIRKGSFSAYSVTGNFRSKSSQIWDPHPEYTMTVFGRRLHIILHQDSSFVEPENFRVIQILNNSTKIQDDENYYLGCFYKGYVLGDDQSSIAVSLCNGMTGHIQTSFGSLLIQPVKKSKSNKSKMLHLVWRHSKRNLRVLLPSYNSKFGAKATDQAFSKLLRKRRNYVDKHLYTMEVLVAVDKTMSEFHVEDLKSYILTLISIVSNIFADASIGNSIHISVPNILILKDGIASSRGKKSISASQLLKLFCSHLKENGIHYDTAIMLTRDQICRSELETKCDTLGLAELGTVCKRYSCSIVQDNGLPAAFTIAHELGHILNMPHDDDSRCRDFRPDGKSKLHIMSSTMGDNIHPWSWSDCSRHYVSEFLEKEDTSCLEDTPKISITNFNNKLPGELYSLDQQCRLIHGNFSKHCFLDGDCTRLWCKAEKHLADCRSSNLPWADGTPCGKNNFWCQKGACVSRNVSKRQAINGGWGNWNAYTPCSMTCGGGVQESLRECNNPFPQNGGKYCGGSRKKYRSCNTQSCPPGSLDSREQQCYDMNGNNFGLKGINTAVKWIPKYGLLGKDKCKLYCRMDNSNSYFQLGDKVKDGTTCSLDTFDKCVNGICRPAGCDNELNSMATLDKCGVCEGRNSTCQEYSGNFFRSDLSNKTNSLYYYVTTIPKGSSNIVITQPGLNTQNYIIVLRNASGGSLLNGDGVINSYRHVFFYAGVSFEYNGSTSTIERVNTSYSRKLKMDLIVQIISLKLETNNRNDSILMSFSYTADKPYYSNDEEQYQWSLKHWSPCDALCQGTTFQIASCINKSTGLKVPLPFCESSAKPRTQSKPCNMDCHLTLNTTNNAECQAVCGMTGKRETNYFCIQTNTSTNKSNLVDLSYCKSKFEINFYEQCQEGCWNYTNWSPCSQTCGSGQQERSVACYINQTQVKNSMCNMNKLASFSDTVRFCNLRPCTDWSMYSESESKAHHYWMTKEWGLCNDNCEKSRSVDCSLEQGCAMEKKPIEKKKCCAIKYIATWSPCSVECGIGSRTKEFYCARVYKSEKKGSRRFRVPIDSKYCNRLRVPTPKRSKKNCKISCKWISENWSTCSSDCRTEFQIRSVNCATVNGKQISSRYCEFTKKPLTRRMCSHCIRREFKLTKCNCEGLRRRRVICSDVYGKRIQCLSKHRILKEKCRPPEECLPHTCADIRRFNRLSSDREYTIFVKQKPVQIYCHNMSKAPKEYITLDPSENYSIYYYNKTRYPNLCPPISRSAEYSDNSIRHGRTHFRKISINITNLRVNENDFTFADSIGTPQSFGSAGDCYNRNGECPQGDFSISFKTTGFFLAPKTKWDLFGNRAVMKMSEALNESVNQKRAFCGGYCGQCSISPDVGLRLEV